MLSGPLAKSTWGAESDCPTPWVEETDDVRGFNSISSLLSSPSALWAKIQGSFYIHWWELRVPYYSRIFSRGPIFVAIAVNQPSAKLNPWNKHTCTCTYWPVCLYASAKIEPTKCCRAAIHKIESLFYMVASNICYAHLPYTWLQQHGFHHSRLGWEDWRDTDPQSTLFHCTSHPGQCSRLNQ